MKQVRCLACGKVLAAGDRKRLPLGGRGRMLVFCAKCAERLMQEEKAKGVRQ